MRELELDPARTAVVVFDMLEAYRAAIEEAGTVPPVQRLLAGARTAGVPVFWARADHRADGADLARTSTDTDQQLRPWTAEHRPPVRPPHGSGSPGLRVLRELDRRDEDYDVPKHRWSAFCATHLELSLRARDADTVLLVGGSTHVGIASTAYAARDLDLQVVVVRDGCHGFAEQREFFLDKVFPRMCCVRTVDEVLAALDGGTRSG
ncbi:MAG: isochorismatase family protein [Actinomycetota bacterium]|nr:isochorismatase family protein [Actinomycetota bacterium]